jgi:uncharacterized protein DUF3179
LRYLPGVRAARLSALLALSAVAACGGREDGAVALPVDAAALPSEAEFLRQVDRTMGARDCFVPVRDGRFVPAADAPRMKDDERVLGLDLGDVQFAYPIQYLNLVEIVEHRAGGRELLACWCPLCGTGVVHERTAADRVLTFGHSGWLWHNAYLLYDRETDSLWHHATGVAMSGPLRGTRLRRYERTAVMTFGAWRGEHPGTLVLAKPADAPAEVERDVYADRNSSRRFGLAVELPGAARFYPLTALADLEAVEEEVAGVPVLVVHDLRAGEARAFDRRVGGRALSFDAVPGDRPRLRERGGRREWWLRSGTAVTGSGALDDLCPLPATTFEAQAWALQHPEGTTWRRP